MDVAFRCDANAMIGSGHVIRCLTLARHFLSLGATVRFITRALPEGLAGILHNNGMEVLSLPQARTSSSDGPYAHSCWLAANEADDAEATIAALADKTPDWLVVDHYGIGRSWEGVVLPHARHIAVIDDLADRPHACDVIIDTSVVAQEDWRYHGLVDKGTACLVGMRYAMLRPGFAEAAETRRPAAREVRRLFVCFGGVDQANHTSLALAAIAALGKTWAVDVVVGSGCPHIPAISALVRRHQSWRLHLQSDDLVRLMLAADLGIGAGGQMTMERACLGLATLAVQAAENQEGQLRQAAAAGFLCVVPPEDLSPGGLSQAIAALALDMQTRQAMSEAGQKLVDGQGVGRIAAAMLRRAGIHVRRAKLADAEMVLDWRNHEKTRAVSGNPSVIAGAAHIAWFQRKLADEACVFLIAESCGLPCGTVRFDITGESATGSIFLAPSFIGLGLGAQILHSAEAEMRMVLPQMRRLSATVKSGHAASERLFASAGYAQSGGHWTKELEN